MSPDEPVTNNFFIFAFPNDFGQSSTPPANPCAQKLHARSVGLPSRYNSCSRLLIRESELQHSQPDKYEAGKLMQWRIYGNHLIRDGRFSSRNGYFRTALAS